MPRKLSSNQQAYYKARIEGNKPYDAYQIAYPKQKMNQNSVSRAAQDLEKHPIIAPMLKEFFEETIKEAETDAVMTKQEALERLSNMGRGNIADLVDFRTIQYEKDGETMEQSVWALKEDLTPEQAACISELTAGRDGFKFKIHDPKIAIRDLGTMLDWNESKDKGDIHIHFDGKAIAL